MLDFEKIKKDIIKNQSVVAKYLPDGIKVGPEYRCANIFGGKGESFAINLNTGLWSDFATGDSGSNLIDLVSKQRGIPFIDAAKIIADDLGGYYETDIINTETMLEKPQRGEALMPCLKQTKPKYVFMHEVGDIEINKLWAYCNEKGFVVAYDARIDSVDQNGKAKKDVIPLRWDGKRWYAKALPSPRILFNYDMIYDDRDGKKQVLVVEGCKTAEAAMHYFPNFIVTTWQGGCKACDKADWKALAGRSVVIVPDADKLIDPKTNDYYEWEDQPGMKAANKIASILHKHRCYVRIVNTRAMGEVKSGWDLADAFEGNMSQADVIEFFRKNIYEYKYEEPKEEEYPEDVIDAHKENPREYDDGYFVCLGVDGKNHYFYPKKTGQVISLTPAQYKRENLINLAPLSWWQASFPAKNGTEWEDAVDWLCRTQEKSGIYDKRRIRGRGAWFDDGRPVLHLGETIFVDGQIMRLNEFRSNYIYEKAPPLAVQLQTVLPVRESQKLIDICRLARWERPYHGDILAGWIFSAMVCGAMPFRSHLYMIGAAGSGKSWMLENVVKLLMGKMALPISSKTTEPGVREALGSDIIPVIYDEAEAENKTDKARVQAIFDLARQASSEGADAIYKGGSNGSGGFSYLCRSSFLFSSINNSMTKDADLSRTSIIRLKTPPLNAPKEVRDADNAKFGELDKQASVTFTDKYRRCLITRAIHFIPKLRKASKTIADICAREYGSRRIGDQMGMILAGIWYLKHDTEMKESDARQLIEYCAIRKDKEDTGDTMTQEERALNFLMQADVTYDRDKYKLATLIAHLADIEKMKTIITADLEPWLLANGVKIDGTRLYLSRNDRSLPAKVFEGTEWDGLGWKDAFLRLPCAENEKARRFTAGLVSGAIVLPLALIFDQSRAA